MLTRSKSRSCENIRVAVTHPREKSRIPRFKKTMAPTLPNMFVPFKFSTTNPKLWFEQLEGVFTIQKIDSDADKFAITKANLDTHVLQEVADFFESLPTEDVYENFKKRVIKEFTDSSTKQLRKLLKGTSLGDRRPTQFLRELKTLSNGQLQPDMLKNLFLEQLPETLKYILAGTNETVEKLAEKGDQILEYAAPTGAATTAQIAAIRPTSAPVTTSVETQSLQTQMNSLNETLRLLSHQVTGISEKCIALQSQVENLQNSNGYRFNNRNSRSRDRDNISSSHRGRSATPSNVPTGVQLCFYHYRYGNVARKCKNTMDGKPCLLANSNSGN